MRSRDIQMALIYAGTSFMIAGTWISVDWKALVARTIVHSLLWFHVIRSLTSDSGSHSKSRDTK